MALDIVEKIDRLLSQLRPNRILLSINYSLKEGTPATYNALNEFIQTLGDLEFDEMTSNKFLYSDKTLCTVKNTIEKWLTDNKVSDAKFILIDYTNKKVEFIGVNNSTFTQDLSSHLTR